MHFKGLLSCLLMFLFTGGAVYGGGWELPGIYGDAKDGWKPGRNWNSNPLPDHGAQWFLYYRTGAELKLMESGKAYRYNFVWRNSGDSFDPEAFFLGTKLKACSSKAPGGSAGPESTLLFTPERSGTYSLNVEGEAAVQNPAGGYAQITIGILDKALVCRQVVVHEEKKNKTGFSWHGKVQLNAGESLAFLLAAGNGKDGGNAGCCFFTFQKFTVNEINGAMFSASLPCRASDWQSRDAEVTIKSDVPNELTLEVSSGPKEWVVVTGPALEIPARNRFAGGRTITATAEAWPEKNGDYVISNYAMQLRLRQNGGIFTRNQSPHNFWETALELCQVQKIRDWTTIDGSSSVAQDCRRLQPELWLAVPRSGKSVIHLRNIELNESFKLSHIINSSPATQNNVFFQDAGAMQVELANAEDIKKWSIKDLDEEGRILSAQQGEGNPGMQHVKLTAPGFHKLMVNAVYLNGSEIAGTSSAAVVGTSLPDHIRMNSRFGSMRVHGNPDFWKKSGCRWDWGIGTIELKDWILEPNGTIRPPANWKTLRHPDDYSVIYSVRNFPRWLYGPEFKDDGGLYPPRDWALFERLFEAFAKANPELTYFSPYNEPNGAWRGTPEEYIRFNTAMANGARRGNSKCRVYGPGDYAIDPENFARYLKGGMFDQLGGVNIHAYVNGTPPEEEFIDRVIKMSAMLKNAGKEHLPVYLTEFGWCAGTGDWQKTISGIDRARYVSRSLALLTAQPVDGILYFCFHYASGAGKDDQEPGYSMLNGNGTPTASYAAFENVVKWLAEVKRGDARWFRLSPNVNLVLGRAPGRIVGAAWTCKGEEPFTLPGMPRRMTDMMGRSLPALSDQVRLSPSPVFFELPADNKFIDLQSLPVCAAIPGDTIPLSTGEVAGVAAITVSGRNAKVANDVADGTYLLVGKKSDGQWIGQPIEIRPPIAVKSLNCLNSADCRNMTAELQLTSLINGEAAVRLTLDSGETTTQKITLRRGEDSKMTLPVPGFRSGARIKGSVAVELLGTIPYKLETGFDRSVMPSAVTSEAQDGSVNWSGINALDISAWGPSRVITATDCRATIKTAIGARNFHVLVDVTDNIHLQGCSPGAMWQEDSIQLAFDMDANKEWQFNNIADGRYNGHRIFYYSIGLPTGGGQVMVWRNRADSPGINAQCLEPKVKARVIRQGQKTVYDLAFPWETLGMNQAPVPGDKIGFSAVVNDADKGEDRHYLCFGNGIASAQKPESFATLQVDTPNP